jgi:NAD(P)H-dependent flavin oxidoreductase YrpB (nitropropane dioxygenase family)
MARLPVVIQGGMGIGVSNWRLAREVSRAGELGVVSGTGLSSVLVRRLQDGDKGGWIRGALNHFPDSTVREEIIAEFFVPGGIAPRTPYKRSPMYSMHSNRKLLRLTVAANFVEVLLAKTGHGGMCGINLLEKIQLATLPSLYGAMLAGVDFVLMGAGIPKEIPGALDRLALHEEASLKIHVEGAGAEEEHRMTFRPREIFALEKFPTLRRPLFFPIVSSSALAETLLKKSNGKVDGFVVENRTAGGHNAPPRGKPQISERGEPVYGPKDEVDFEKFRALGVPYWIAGSFASTEKLKEAWRLGAAGVQLGTAFAFCRESGVDEKLKERVLNEIKSGGHLNVFTDPLASPSGFPFKVVELEGTLGDGLVAENRPRKCDLGYLRRIFKKADGSYGYRCPSEPVENFVRKGGSLEETKGRKCLCNSLLSTVGLAQTQESGYEEPPLVTSGEDLSCLKRFLKGTSLSYSARDVVEYLRTALSLEPLELR